MAVVDKISPTQYTATTGETQFEFEFEIFEDADIKAYLTPVGTDSDPAGDLLTLNVDYTVTIDQSEGDGSGPGYITLIVAATAGDILTLDRDMVKDRPPSYDFKVGGDFTTERLNENMDKEYMIAQQANYLITQRGVLYPVTDELDAGNRTLPKLGAAQIWVANSSGNLVAGDLAECSDCSTLRSELISETMAAPGSDDVGYYDLLESGGKTLTTMVNEMNQRIYDLENFKYKGSFYGFRISNNVSDLNHDIDISVGECSNISGSILIQTSSVFTKKIDVDWVEGTGEGGFPSALALTADTAYYVFAIVKIDETVDFGFDTSLTATNLLADATDYSSYRRIGCVLTNGSTNIRETYELPSLGGGKHVYYKTAVTNLDRDTPATGSEQTLATSVPPGVPVVGFYEILNIETAGTGATFELDVRGSGQTVTIESGGGFSDALSAIKRLSTIELPVSDGNIYWYGAATGVVTTDNRIMVKTMGWFDPLTNELV